MNAVDTNILVRLLTADDVRQTAAARALFQSGPIWIGKTVLLETAWVLRSAYGLDEREIAETVARLLTVPGVIVEDDSAVLQAMQLVIHGLEFADALHLTSRPAGAGFQSFDEKFVKRAKHAGVRNISTVSAV
ncbi:MAG TPA: type II toxin-antitoxin system VapC family toxin [Bryobacteraceae bacterium]|nr:type II toxin-antitoxin system VapC family toxin [Bryobacteraceae bacterium]